MLYEAVRSCGSSYVGPNGSAACQRLRSQLRLRRPAPQVLLLDELTTFLDYEDQENVLRCVRRIVDSSRQQHGQQQLAAAAAAGGDAASGAAASAAAGTSEAGVTALWVTHRLEELDYADSVR